MIVQVLLLNYYELKMIFDLIKGKQILRYTNTSNIISFKNNPLLCIYFVLIKYSSNILLFCSIILQ